MNSSRQILVKLYISVFQELMELIAKSNSLSTAELSQMKAELKLKQKVKVLMFCSFFSQLFHIFM